MHDCSGIQMDRNRVPLTAFNTGFAFSFANADVSLYFKSRSWLLEADSILGYHLLHYAQTTWSHFVSPAYLLSF